jgi:hypothetical protein
LSDNDLLERLASWFSRLPSYRVVHEPWERGGQPRDIGLAVELIVGAILGFDEEKHLKNLSA